MFKFFENLLKKLGGPTPRIYHFPLPYKIEVIYLHYGLAQLRQAGLFQKLPKDLQRRWEKALESWHPLRVTADDLDRIDDDTWKEIAAKLNLRWEFDKE